MSGPNARVPHRGPLLRCPRAQGDGPRRKCSLRWSLGLRGGTGSWRRCPAWERPPWRGTFPEASTAHCRFPHSVPGTCGRRPSMSRALPLLPTPSPEPLEASRRGAQTPGGPERCSGRRVVAGDGGVMQVLNVGPRPVSSGLGGTRSGRPSAAWGPSALGACPAPRRSEGLQLSLPRPPFSRPWVEPRLGSAPPPHPLSEGTGGWAPSLVR